MGDSKTYTLYCGDHNDPCPRCGDDVSLHVAEAVDGDKIVWILTSQCVGCRHTDVTQGRPAVLDAVDPTIRQALVARVGHARVHADPDANRTLRLRALALFRRRGATIAGAAHAYASLTDAGITGTPAEMALLADYLTAEGIAVSLHHQDNDRDAASDST
jgi:hypothetical protein